MTDLTNKIDSIIRSDVNSIQLLVNKYHNILVITKLKRQIPYLAYIINESEKFLIEKHNDVSSDLKAWSVMVVREFFEKNLINDENEIPKIIDEFILYWELNYLEYCENIVTENISISTEHYKDKLFMENYLNKKWES